MILNFYDVLMLLVIFNDEFRVSICVQFFILRYWCFLPCLRVWNVWGRHEIMRLNDFVDVNMSYNMNFLLKSLNNCSMSKSEIESFYGIEIRDPEGLQQRNLQFYILQVQTSSLSENTSLSEQGFTQQRETMLECWFLS